LINHIKKIIGENKILLTGVLMILLSIIMIMTSSISEVVEKKFDIKINIDNGFTDILQNMLSIEEVSESISGVMNLTNRCPGPVNISIYMPPPVNISISETLDPNKSVIIQNVSLNTLIRIYPFKNCFIEINGLIIYRTYRYAWLNLFAFVFVASGSIMIFRHMMYSMRRLEKSQE
jgi:hypothetical protein